ncbi:MAG: response regulator [Anaerolineae bacterium]
MTERPKILYVEDNLMNRMLVRRLLEAEGYTVLEAEDGLSGIKMAQEELPDLILMDINIPGMDGFEATTKLKSIEGLKDTPIVALTARVMDGDREMALTAGCDGYIPKPIDVDTLPDLIRDFMAGKREMVAVAEERVYLREYSQKLVDRLQEKIEELMKANEELRYTDEMKSRFISIAAHELRTPLTIIQGYLSMLTQSGGEATYQLDDNAVEAIQGITTGMERLTTIVEDMLDVTRIESGALKLHMGPVSLKDVITAAARKLKTFAEERKQEIVVADLSGMPPVKGDANRLLQVFMNLIGNSIKYTPDGGRISLNVRGIEPGEVLAPQVQSAGQSAFIEVIVEDTGVGIAEEDQERIFKRFYEVKDPSLHSTSKTSFKGGGLGLGLPTARGIAEAHGGWLWVESEGYDEEKCPGSRFHVLLPIAAKAAGASSDK